MYCPYTFSAGYASTDAGWERLDSIELPTSQASPSLFPSGVVSQFDDGLLAAWVDSSGELRPAEAIDLPDDFNRTTHSARLDPGWLSVTTRTSDGILLLRYGLSDDGAELAYTVNLGEQGAAEYPGGNHYHLQSTHLEADYVFANGTGDDLSALVYLLGEEDAAPIDLPDDTRTVLPLRALSQPADADPSLVDANPLLALAWSGPDGELPTLLRLLQIDGTDVETLSDWEIPTERFFGSGVESYDEAWGFLRPTAIMLRGDYLVATDQDAPGDFFALRIEDHEFVEAGTIPYRRNWKGVAIDDWYLTHSWSSYRLGRWGSEHVEEFGLADSVLAHIRVGDYRAEIVDPATDAPAESTLRISAIDGRAADESETWPLPATADVLLPGATSLVAPVVADEVCDQALDRCEPQEPGVFLVHLDPEVRLEEVSLPELPESFSNDTMEVSARWIGSDDSGMLSLGGDRWLFAAEVIRDCRDGDTCETPDFEFEGADIGETWSGYVAQRWYFELSLDDDGEPRWSAPLASTLSTTSDAWEDEHMFSDGRNVYVERRERLESEEDGPRRYRVRVDPLLLADGEVSAQPAVELPGFLRGVHDGSLITISAIPGSGGGGEVQRLRLTEDGVEIEASLTVPGSYVDLTVAGKFGLLLTDPPTLCGGPRVLTLLRLEEPMGVIESYEFPGQERWEFAAASESLVLLNRYTSPSDYLGLDISEQGVSVARVHTTDCASYAPVQLRDRTLYCEGYGMRRRLEF